MKDFLKRNNLEVSICVIAIAAMCSFVILSGQTTPQFTKTLYRSAFAFEQLAITSISSGFTSATYNPTATDTPSFASRAEFADVECDSHNIRFWLTSQAPTSSGGILLQTGSILTIQGFHDIVNFKAISADGSTAVCNVQYYRFITNTP